MAYTSFSNYPLVWRACLRAGGECCPCSLPVRACPVITMPTPHLETISWRCRQQWLARPVTVMAALCLEVCHHALGTVTHTQVGFFLTFF